MLSTLYSLNHTAGELVKNMAKVNGGTIVERGSYNGPPKDNKEHKGNMFDV